LRRLLEAEEDLLELHHTGVGEEQGGVVGGDERGAGADGVALPLEVVEEAAADFGSEHSLGSYAPYPRRDNGTQAPPAGGRQVNPSLALCGAGWFVSGRTGRYSWRHAAPSRLHPERSPAAGGRPAARPPDSQRAADRVGERTLAAGHLPGSRLRRVNAGRRAGGHQRPAGLARADPRAGGAVLRCPADRGRG